MPFCSVSTDQRFDLPRRRLGVVLLDREDNDVDRTDLRRIVGRRDRLQMQIAIGAIERQPFVAQRRQMRAARDEVHVFSSGRQPRAEIAADAACRHHRDFHRHVTALP
jgi:hypothetical protein